MTEEDLAKLDHAAFLAAFGDVFEHSPWIAAGAWPQAPFHAFKALHGAMVGVLDTAGSAAGMALVRAHPDLAGKAALAGDLTEDSRAEQKASGLAGLAPDELARFTTFNAAYKAKFGFPFVMAVRKSGKDEILAAFEERLGNDLDAELARSLSEIKMIAWLRLEAIAARPS
jgi:2-oxo-4-hydroxy-4-carboxy-5-ureidoimidazoline decarboxylase